MSTAIFGRRRPFPSHDRWACRRGSIWPPPQPCENAAIAGPLDKQLLFVTGKGGVGKTTIAYALGLAATAAGRRALVCEIAAQERGSAIFGHAPIGFREEELSKGLWAISIDPEHAGRDYLERQMPVRSMGSILARSNLFAYLAAATPGLGEMVTMGKVWELANRERRVKAGQQPYDVVVVDAPATGHGIAFLRTPHEFREIARVGPLATQASRIEETLADGSGTGLVIVARPEEMAVNEAIALEESLAGAGEGTRFDVDRVYVNAMYPSRFTGAELRRLAKLGCNGAGETWAGGPAVGAALAEGARASGQRRQVERLRASVTAEIAELPFLFEPKDARDGIEALAKAVV